MVVFLTFLSACEGGKRREGVEPFAHWSHFGRGGEGSGFGNCSGKEGKASVAVAAAAAAAACALCSCNGGRKGLVQLEREEFEAEKGERTLMEIPPLYSRSQMDGKRGGGGGGKWTQGERK